MRMIEPKVLRADEQTFDVHVCGFLEITKHSNIQLMVRQYIYFNL